MEVIGSRSLGIVGLFHLFRGRNQPSYIGVRTSVYEVPAGHPSNPALQNPCEKHVNISDKNGGGH